MEKEQFEVLQEILHGFNKRMDAMIGVLQAIRRQTDAAEEMGRVIARMTAGLDYPQSDLRNTPPECLGFGQKDLEKKADLISQILELEGLGFEESHTPEEHERLDVDRQVHVVSTGLYELDVEGLEKHLCGMIPVPHPHLVFEVGKQSDKGE